MNQCIQHDSIKLSEHLALAVFYKKTASFCSATIQLRKEFQSDIDKLLVYLIILLDDVAREGKPTSTRNVGVSALSISDITGIPRETVRRKLSILIDEKTIRRQGHAHFHIDNTKQPTKINEILNHLLINDDGRNANIIPNL